MEAVFEALKEYWAEWGIRPNPGAPDAELAEHEQRYGLRLPPELRSYFRVVNGMSSGPESRRDMDDDMIRFYPLAECRPLDVEWPDTGVVNARSFLCFADYSIWVWGYAVRLGTGPRSGSVHVLSGQDELKVADSFEEFVEAYLRRDFGVTFPW